MKQELKQYSDECSYQEDSYSECQAENDRNNIKKAIKMVLDDETSYDEVRDFLIDTCNYDSEDADNLTNDLSEWRLQYDEANSSANRDIGMGLVWLIGGSLVTALTYSAASNGGRYVLAGGAIIYGFLRFILGIILKIKAIHSKHNLYKDLCLIM